jgi:hypothetical protein
LDLSEPLPLDGNTVGKSPDGFVGDVIAPSGSEPPGSERPGRPGSEPSVGSEPPDGGGVGDGVGVGAGAAVTLTVELALPDVAPLACAVAVSVILVPGDAPAETAVPASSSQACPVDSGPRLQTLLFAFAQIANVGAATSGTFPVLTVTDVALLAAPVVHTRIAKLAVLPGVTMLLR